MGGSCRRTPWVFVWIALFSVQSSLRHGEASSDAAVKAETQVPSFPWERIQVACPLQGFEFADPKKVYIRVRGQDFFGSIALQENRGQLPTGSYNPSDWQWQLYINNKLGTVLELDPEHASSTIYIDTVASGRHNLELLITGADGVQIHHSIFRHFFVGDPNEEHSRFHTLESSFEQDREAKRARLLGWGREVTGGFQKVDISDDEFGGSGLFANSDIEAGEIIARLPYSATPSPESSAHLGFPEMWEALFLDDRTPPDLITAMLLLVELEEKSSFFQHYLDLLPPPSRMDSVYYWSDDVLQASRVSEAVGSYADTCIPYFERVYDRFFAVVEHHHAYTKVAGSLSAFLFTREKIKWAFSLIMSRAWGHQTYGAREGFHRLLPIADIANHGNPEALPHGFMDVKFDDSQQIVLFFANGSIPSGSQIFTSYGGYGNDKLLVQYGFAAPNNHFHLTRIPQPEVLELDDTNRQIVQSSGIASDEVAISTAGLLSQAVEYHQLIVSLSHSEVESCSMDAECAKFKSIKLLLKKLESMQQRIRHFLSICEKDTCSATETRPLKALSSLSGSSTEELRISRLAPALEIVAMQELEMVSTAIRWTKHLWLGLLTN